MKDDIDLAILLNHGKTLTTGRYFGRIISSRIDDSVPFVHIERPDHKGRIIYYYPPAKRCAEFVRNFLVKYDGYYDLQLNRDDLLLRISGMRGLHNPQNWRRFAGENIRLDELLSVKLSNPKLRSYAGVEE